MEIVLCCIVGFIAFIAGRAMVGTNAMTTEHAHAIAMEMYEKGRARAKAEAMANGSLETDRIVEATLVTAAELLDEYINGYSFAMKAVREHGLDAERATKAHIAGVVETRNEAARVAARPPRVVRV